MSQTTRRVEAFAAVSLKLVEAMRQAFPVEGLPWPAAGQSEQQALQPFVDLLPGFAACWWGRNDRGRQTLDEAWQTLNPRPENPEALQALICGWLRVFSHSGWGKVGVLPYRHPLLGWLDRRETAWSWPDVPSIPASYLDEVAEAARRLTREVPRVAKRKRPTPHRTTRGEANEFMMDAIQADADRLKWSAREWARHVGCSTWTIAQTEVWKQGRVAREKAKQERMRPGRDRRRRPRHHNKD
jgi:hypothetical protein